MKFKVFVIATIISGLMSGCVYGDTKCGGNETIEESKVEHTWIENIEVENIEVENTI